MKHIKMLECINQAKNAQLKFHPNKLAMAEYDTYAKDNNLMF